MYCTEHDMSTREAVAAFYQEDLTTDELSEAVWAVIREAEGTREADLYLELGWHDYLALCLGLAVMQG